MRYRRRTDEQLGKDKMKSLIAIATFIATAATAVVMSTAAVAHADEQSFLDALGPRYYPPTSLLSHGAEACGYLRDGMSPMDAQRLLGVFGLGLMSDFTGIAQRELCPDTLH